MPTSSLRTLTASQSRKKGQPIVIIFLKKRALEENGSLLEGKHIRVDVTSKPAGVQATPDHRRSIFVGNLPFVATDEHLWEAFASSGEIEAVRLVRDAHTNVGKGFAFVTFKVSPPRWHEKDKPQKKKLFFFRTKAVSLLPSSSLGHRSRAAASASRAPRTPRRQTRRRSENKRPAGRRRHSRVGPRSRSRHTRATAAVDLVPERPSRSRASAHPKTTSCTEGRRRTTARPRGKRRPTGSPSPPRNK